MKREGGKDGEKERDREGERGREGKERHTHTEREDVGMCACWVCKHASLKWVKIR